MTNRHSNLRLLSTRLFLAACFIVGLTAAPIDPEIGSDPGKAESSSAESAVPSPRAWLLPFLPPSPGSEGKDPPASGLPGFPPLLPGFGNKDTPPFGLPGLPDISPVIDGMKLFLGAHQTVQIPVPNVGNFLELLGNLPKLPGLPFPFQD